MIFNEFNKLNKKIANYVVNQYYKNEHIKQYCFVMQELNSFIPSCDQDVDGSYILLRIDGMPELLNIY